jgi:CRP-like cAMP-binding protein
MVDAWLRREWIAPGMDLIVQGGEAGQLYVLRSGKVDVFRDGSHITTIATPGSVIGEMGVLLGVPHTATVKAVTEAEFFVIDNALDVLAAKPELLLQIARLLARRVDATTALLARDRADSSHTLVLPETLISSWGDPTL